jgi:hypothetical protein
MRRAKLALTLPIGIGLVLVACASPGGTPGASGGSEPSVPPSQSEVAAASQPAASQPTGGDIGKAGAPPLADGPWTGGQAQTTVSGAVNRTTDAPISTEGSRTVETKTSLAYNTDDTFVTILINKVVNFKRVPFDVGVTSPDWSVESAQCEVTYARADDAEIDATFSCVVPAVDFHYFPEGADPTGEILIEGSFTATR